MERCCFFIGHREAPESLLPILIKEVERHIVEYGVSSFIVGNYGNVDHLAARAVLASKEKYPHITLTMLLPYHPAEKSIDLPKGFDGSVYPDDQEGVPRRFAIPRANRWAIDHSDFLICYITHLGSNAVKYLDYGRRREKTGSMRITRIGDSG